MALTITRTNARRPQGNGNISTVQTLSDMGFTQNEIDDARRAFVTGHDGDLVYQVNGMVPTATTGHIINSEITSEITESAGQLQLVAQSGTVITTVELETYE